MSDPGKIPDGLHDLKERVVAFATTLASACAEPLPSDHENRVAFLRSIGMEPSIVLEMAGTHLGSLIGGAATLGVTPHVWVDYLMALALGATARLETETLSADACEYLRASRGIAEECMALIESCVASDADAARSMRVYLEVLTALIDLSIQAARAGRTE
jgi:hypothetical protein